MRVLLAIAVWLVCVPASAAEKLAVLPFDANGVDEDLQPLGRGIADMLITDLQRADGVVVVERRQLSQVLRELELQASGFVDPETALQVGQGVGAQRIVTGGITAAIEGMRIDARLVDVASGEVIDAVSAAGAPDDFFALEADIANQLLGKLGSTVQIEQRQLSLDQALQASQRLDEMENAYVDRLGNLNTYKRRRLKRDDLTFQTGGGDAAVSTVKTWAFYDGGGTLIAPQTVMERLNDTERLAKLNKHKRIGRTIVWTSLGVGLAACAGTGIYAATGPDPDRFVFGSSAYERADTRRFSALWGCLLGPAVGLAGAYPGAMIAGRQKYAGNYWELDEADEAVDEHNRQLGQELGLTERDRREADLRE